MRFEDENCALAGIESCCIGLYRGRKDDRAAIIECYWKSVMEVAVSKNHLGQYLTSNPTSTFWFSVIEIFSDYHEFIW